MFGKYFIHELKNTCRFPLIACAIGLATSALMGICFLFPVDDKLFVLYYFIFLLFIVALGAMAVISIITIIRTFKSRLFNQQGYLTLTLPVTTHNILLTKLLINLIYMIVYLLVVYLMAYLGFAGPFTGLDLALIDLIKALVGDNFLVGFLIVLQNLLYYASVLTFILFLMSVYHSGGKKGVRIVIVIGLIVGLLIINSVINAANTHSLYYIIEEGKKYYLFTSEVKMEALFEEKLNEGIYLETTKAINLAEWIRSIILMIGSYIGSYYLVKYKLDIN